MTKFSVIIPVYNCEKYLKHCVASVMNQTERNWELILIDDGSTDSSPDICDELQHRDSRIKVFHKKNEGPSVARNCGLQYAEGEWIQFIDADDWIDLNHFEFLSLEISQKNPDLIYFGYKRHFSNHIERCSLDRDIYVDSPEGIDEQLSFLILHPEQYFGYTCNKLFRRSIIKKYNISFPEDLKIKEDEIFTLNYCRHISSLSLFSLTPYHYRMLDTSLSHSKNTYVNYRDLISYILDLQKENIETHVYHAFIGRIFSYYFNAVVRAKKKGETIKLVSEMDSFYQLNKEFIEVSSRIGILFNIPIRFLRSVLLCLYFFYLKLTIN